MSTDAASLTFYSDWHFCSACGLPPAASVGEKSNNDNSSKKKKLSTCRRCKTAAYHNAECQKDHWKRRHKRDCDALKKAIQPLLEIVDCWKDFNVIDNNNNKNNKNKNENKNKKTRVSWWNFDRLDREGAKESYKLWETNEKRWNRHGEYLEAMAGFQKALKPVSKLWKKRMNEIAQNGNKNNQSNTTGTNDTNDSESISCSKLSLEETNNNDDNNKNDVNDASVSNAKGIVLARKLLFCAYCEADGNQIESSRIRLAQCISILLECARHNYCCCKTTNDDSSKPKQTRQQQTSYSTISLLLNDAWMELMLSYEEEHSQELRKISRHVVHLAIQSSCKNTLYKSEWIDPLQRPGYMAPLVLEEDTPQRRFETAASPLQARLVAPPFIPRQDHPSWCQTLEANWKEIALELFSLHTATATATSAGIPSRHNNANWTVVGSGDRGSGADDHRVVSPGGKWTEHVLFGTGASSSSASFTKKLLRECVPDAVSLAEAGGGEVIFSKLEPHTKIAAHCGPTNLRWTAHLGLVVPSNNNKNNSKSCCIRVANEWHQWETGKILLFDDSYEHEIRNETDEIRIVLLLRLWHPGLALHRRQTELDMALKRKEEAVEKRYRAPSV